MAPRSRHGPHRRRPRSGERAGARRRVKRLWRPAVVVGDDPVHFRMRRTDATVGKGFEGGRSSPRQMRNVAHCVSEPLCAAFAPSSSLHPLRNGLPATSHTGQEPISADLVADLDDCPHPRPWARGADKRPVVPCVGDPHSFHRPPADQVLCWPLDRAGRRNHDAVRRPRSTGDHVTPEVLRADLASLEARLTWRFAGAMLAQTLAILRGVLGMLRLLGVPRGRELDRMAPRRVDPYEVLGLERGATWAEIRAAYRRLAKKHHPDKNPGDNASEWIFKEVGRAYEHLRGVHGAHAQTEERTRRGDDPGRQSDYDHRERQARAQWDREQRQRAERGRQEQERAQRREREQRERRQAQAARERREQPKSGRTARDSRDGMRREQRGWGARISLAVVHRGSAGAVRDSHSNLRHPSRSRRAIGHGDRTRSKASKAF